MTKEALMALVKRKPEYRKLLNKRTPVTAMNSNLKKVLVSLSLEKDFFFNSQGNNKKDASRNLIMLKVKGGRE